MASSSAAPGIFGPALAFRGEIEAQGRGSLHPHVRVWLVMHPSQVQIRLLRRQPAAFRGRLASWMKVCVTAIESTCQSSVDALPRRFGRYGEFLSPLSRSIKQRGRTRFDGGSEVDVLREEEAAGAVLTE